MDAYYEIPVFIFGPGRVGGELIRQIVTSRGNLMARKNIYLKIIGIGCRSMCWYDPSGYSDSQVIQILNSYRDLRNQKNRDGKQSYPDLPPGSVIVDTTDSAEISSLLRNYLNSGCGVVLANKKPLSNSWQDSSIFFEHPYVRREATVCAGLPIMYTLDYLQNTGDHILSIQGKLSGTLGFLCGLLGKGIPYSKAVLDAYRQGYTEPDPREDLNGQDVARKILILARMAGFRLEPEAVSVESLIPSDLVSVSKEKFMMNIQIADDEYLERSKSAEQRGKCLQYIASVTEKGGYAALEEVESFSMPATMRGPESFVAVTTDRYHENPLVLTGPGSGPGITAAAIYQDVLELGMVLQNSMIKV